MKITYRAHFPAPTVVTYDARLKLIAAMALHFFEQPSRITLESVL